jgi:hypothetical protein
MLHALGGLALKEVLIEASAMKKMGMPQVI